MSFLASLAMLTVLVPPGTPQGQGPQDAAASQPGVLTPAERLTLREKLAKYLLEDADYEQSTGKDREKASRSREKARDSFDEAWRKADAKGALGSMVDLRGIFENCFLRKPPAKSLGQLWTDKTKESGFDFGYYLPKSYKHTVPMRTIWTVTGAGPADGTWTKPAEWFTATWDKTASAADTLFHVAMPQAGMELDPVPDYSRESGEADEQRRIQFMWSTFAEVMLNHNVDRNRVYLDCGRGSCAFGVRFLSMFPDRFAGAVLRAPTEVEDSVRLGSLLGLPILLLRAPANAKVVDALKARLDEASPNTTTVLDVTDEYPHKGATAQIEDWLKTRQRSMVPKRVVIEPNSDKFNRAYWADIEVAERLLTAAADKKPRLEVQADRDANRITVKAVGVERFTLLLNDDIVDLSKEFTVVVNDKAFPEKKTRSFPDMLELMITRSDWEFLFPAKFTTVVPK